MPLGPTRIFVGVTTAGRLTVHTKRGWKLTGISNVCENEVSTGKVGMGRSFWQQVYEKDGVVRPVTEDELRAVAILARPHAPHWRDVGCRRIVRIKSGLGRVRVGVRRILTLDTLVLVARAQPAPIGCRAGAYDTNGSQRRSQYAGPPRIQRRELESRSRLGKAP